MKLIGKIGILFLLSSTLFGANINVSSSQIVLGEAIRFEISASGKDIEFPDINKIENASVQRLGSGISTSNVNGKVTTTKTQSYLFYPQTTLTIPAFIVKVDGKDEYTKQVPIKIISQEKMDKRLPYNVSLHVNEENPYVGQMIKLSIKLKTNERLNIKDLKISSIKGLDNFWSKDKPIQQSSNENGYIVNKVDYWLSPLKDGNQTIGPVVVKLGFPVQNNDPFGGFFGRSLRYKSIQSNSIKLHVKPLPSKAKVAGDFTIEAIVDKNEVNAGKPANVVVKVKGKGNLEELESLKSDVKDVIIYEDKPKIESKDMGGVYESSWRQKIAYIGSKDFVIPPFNLTFFDTKTKTIKTIKTEPISVHVKGEVAKSVEDKSEIVKPIQTKIIVKETKTNWLWILTSFILGLSLGILLSKINFKSLPAKTKIFKNDKELLQEMLAYKSKDKNLDEWIFKLEENIYKDKKHQINKKIIQNLIKNLNNK